MYNPNLFGRETPTLGLPESVTAEIRRSQGGQGIEERNLEDLKQRVEKANHIRFGEGQGQPAVGVEEIMELNLKLREDLTRSFEAYIKVLAAADKLQKENSDMKLKLAQGKRAEDADNHLLKVRIASLAKQATERDEQMQKMAENYERRLQSMKVGLEDSTASNKSLLKDLNNLQLKYMRDTRETSEGQLHDLIKEKAHLLIKIEQ